jgi:hypothetical protein
VRCRNQNPPQPIGYRQSSIGDSPKALHHELFQDAVISFSASDGEKVAAAG